MNSWDNLPEISTFDQYKERRGNGEESKAPLFIFLLVVLLSKKGKKRGKR